MPSSLASERVDQWVAFLGVRSSGAFAVDARVGKLGHANGDGHAIIALPPGRSCSHLAVGQEGSSDFRTIGVDGAADEVLIRDVAFPSATDVVNPECVDISDLPDRR